ncbi:uncharacterized protein N7515_008206 [Penicillium bovifimosum]|uniref:LysM domain-containing protein n=1 Tax=Penicillium bovifimosum TaxID=126998 RepID=A0A9W9GML8_9EURO|nr:uncharacterized protein N7515_008206 [Penicillium bovifimosum]KAJ5124381.1 hypothetical protein N7515_008206 [Penicillium bovifimosum]
MFFPSLILAAGSLATLIQAIPHGATHRSLHRRAAATYAVMGGNGDISDGWPSMAQWAEYETLWSLNKILIAASCDNSDDETSDIDSSIKSVASQTGVDPRFILAIVMQESKGCVRVHTTNNGVQNTGLMQSHAGEGSCNKDGSQTTPCPSSMIKQMIEDGTAGTPQGDGLKQCLATQSGSDATKYYKAARTYNSGSIDPSGNLGAGGATHCYASDIANRLRGWAGDVTECLEGTIGSITKGLASLGGSASADDSSDDSSDESSSSSTTTAAAQVTEPAEPVHSTQTLQPVHTTETVPPVQTSSAPNWAPDVNMAAKAAPTPSWTTKSAPAATTAATTAGSSSAPLYPDASPSCREYYTVLDGDFCNKLTKTVGITFPDLRSLNSGLDEKCTNLWLGYQYCIKA